MLDNSVLTAALRRHPVAHQAFLEFTERFQETWVAGRPHPMPATFAHGPDGVLRVRQSLPLPDGEEVVLEGEQISREVPSTPG